MRDLKYYFLRSKQLTRRFISVGFYNRSERKIEILTVLFRQVNKFLRDLGVEYCITYGTLLGYLRNGKILTHDTDVDFAVFEPDYDLIRNAGNQLPRGFSLHDTSGYHRGPKLYVSYKGFDADIQFFCDRAGQYITTEIDENPRYMLPFRKQLISPLKSANFLSESTFIPADGEGYLTFLFGYLGENGKLNKKTWLWEPREPA